MSRLIWLELRVKWGWGLAVVTGACAPILLGDWLSYPRGVSSWLFLPVVLAMLLGAGTFDNETRRGTADTLFALPITWMRLVAAKVLVASGFLAAAVAASALTCLLLRPDAYRDVFTLPHLAPGAWELLRMMATCYALGLAGSAILPGLAGGVLVCVLTAAALVTYVGLLSASLHRQQLWAEYGVLASAVLAGLVAARSLTRPVAMRAARYASVIVACTLLLLPLDVTMPGIRRAPVVLGRHVASFSPDGRYAFVGDGIAPLQGDGPALHPGIPGHLGLDEHRILCWVPPRTLYTSGGRGLIRTCIGDDGEMPSAPVPGTDGVTCAIPSPDRRLLLCFAARDSGHPVFFECESLPGMRTPEARLAPTRGWRYLTATRETAQTGLLILDASSGRLLSRIRNVGPGLRWWWQSNTEVGYIDRDGRRHVAAVALPQGAVPPHPAPLSRQVHRGSQVSSPIKPHPLYSSRTIRAAPEPATTVPLDLPLVSTDGGKATLGQLLHGKKAVLIDFWSSGCGICMQMMDRVDDWSKALAPQGVVVVGLNVWERDAAKAASVKEEKQLSMPWLVESRDQPYTKALQIRTLPHMALVTPDGKVRFAGDPQAEGLEDALAKLGVTP